MTEIALSFFIGFLVGLVIRPKDKDMLDDVLERNENTASTKKRFSITKTYANGT